MFNRCSIGPRDSIRKFFLKKRLEIAWEIWAQYVKHQELVNFQASQAGQVEADFFEITDFLLFDLRTQVTQHNVVIMNIPNNT